VRALILMCVLVMAGCAPLGMPSQPTKPVAQHGWAELCHFYYKNPTAELRQEIQGRRGFSENEWRSIDAHEIRKGMRTEALVCSRGLPVPFGDINNSAGSWGLHTQWVYRKCNRCDATYVYSENGTVTGWAY